MRPRWVGAMGAVLIATVALAATLVVPPASAPELDVKQFGAAAPVAAKSSVPPGTIVEQRHGLDDDVPGAGGITKARAGGCEYGL